MPRIRARIRTVLRFASPAPAAVFKKAHYFAALRAGQVEDQQPPDASASASATTSRVIPITEIDNPLFASADDYPVDKNNFQPRVGLAYDVDGRSVIRGGYGRFYDKTHFELIGGIYTGDGVLALVVRAQLPAEQLRSGAAQRQLPDRSVPRQRPVHQPTRCVQHWRRSSRPGRRVRNTGATWDNPDRVMPYTDQLTVGYERQLAGNLSLSADYVHVVLARPAHVA